MALKLLNNFKTLGGHWIPHHNRASERIFFGNYFQVDILKLIDGDVQQVHDIYVKRPNMILVLRDHPMSEQKKDMREKPVETGKRHAQEWAKNVERLRDKAAKQGLLFPPNEQILVLGINEPSVWEVLEETVKYNVAFLDELFLLGLYGGALNLSVGWPANTGTDTPPNWNPYFPVYEAIVRGGHVLVLHEYWSHRGPHEMWRWWAGRYLQCPWDVPILIGEAGVDEYVADGNIPGDKRGWGAWLSEQEYADQLLWYSERLKEDNRIIGFTPFTSDYASDHWKTFDIQNVYPKLDPEKYIAGRPMYTKGKAKPVEKPDISKIKFGRPFIGSYWLTQKFGVNPANYRPYNGHTGIDWGMPIGTNIVAVEDGEVIEAETYGDWGNYVKIKHSWGHSVYAHLNEIFVNRGDKVVQREVIGKSGNTGRSTGPHLHFGVRFEPYNRSDEWNGYSNPGPHFVSWGDKKEIVKTETREVTLGVNDKLVVRASGPFSIIVESTKSE